MKFICSILMSVDMGVYYFHSRSVRLELVSYILIQVAASRLLSIMAVLCVNGS